MHERVSILIADDDPSLREVWEQLVGRQDDMRVVGSCGSADHLAELIASSTPDVVLIDLTMPGADVCEAIESAASAFPLVKILVFSGRADGATVQRAMDAGAWGFVDKLSDPRDVLGAIRRVASGEVVIPSPSGER